MVYVDVTDVVWLNVIAILTTLCSYGFVWGFSVGILKKYKYSWLYVSRNREKRAYPKVLGNKQPWWNEASWQFTFLQPRNELPFKIEGPVLFLFNLNFFCVRLRLRKHRYFKHVEYFSCTSKMCKMRDLVALTHNPYELRQILTNMTEIWNQN